MSSVTNLIFRILPDNTETIQRFLPVVRPHICDIIDYHRKSLKSKSLYKRFIKAYSSLIQKRICELLTWCERFMSCLRCINLTIRRFCLRLKTYLIVYILSWESPQTYEKRSCTHKITHSLAWNENSLNLHRSSGKTKVTRVSLLQNKQSWRVF